MSVSTQTTYLSQLKTRKTERQQKKDYLSIRSSAILFLNNPFPFITYKLLNLKSCYVQTQKEKTQMKHKMKDNNKLCSTFLKQTQTHNTKVTS